MVYIHHIDSKGVHGSVYMGLLSWACLLHISARQKHRTAVMGLNK